MQKRLCQKTRHIIFFKELVRSRVQGQPLVHLQTKTRISPTRAVKKNLALVGRLYFKCGTINVLHLFCLVNAHVVLMLPSIRNAISGGFLCQKVF